MANPITGIFTDPFINWRRVRVQAVIAFLIWAIALFPFIMENKSDHRRIVLVVIDGLRPDAITKLGRSKAPHFHYLMSSGAYTLNARTDVRSTMTMPNVISMLTGRPVMDGPWSHGYRKNIYLGGILHDVKDEYIYSIFDVIKDASGRSAFFSSKSNLGIMVKSYTSLHEIDKEIDPKDRNKFQSYVITNHDDESVFEAFERELLNFDASFIYLHLSLPDVAGHTQGWSLEPDSPYLIAVQEMDNKIGRILKDITATKHLRGNVNLIVTSDHGGKNRSHINLTDVANYRVPFFVWGPDVAKGADLYKLNKEIRRNPRNRLISFASDLQPIRNSESGNLALSLLKLPPIPNSVINGLQSLRVK